MNTLINVKTIKQKLDKLWRSHKLHRHWLQQQRLPQQALFPYRMTLGRPGDKTLLHQFDQVKDWIRQLTAAFANHGLVELHRQQINYGIMGRQSIPVAIEFADIEKLTRFIGKWGQWQQFCQTCHDITREFPLLGDWLEQCPGNIGKYQQDWPQLLAVCRYFQRHPRPDCYIRELDIIGVDSKFVEKRKQILSALLDRLLPATAIDSSQHKLTNHGFEKRYGLKYELPRVHFRLLDSRMSEHFGGLSDLEVPIDQFAALNLNAHLNCDRVFICENKTNGLAFPPVNNALVIFGLGYGLQILQQVDWLRQCRLYYWGDIDSHGFAMLSQARSYFPELVSLLMDEQTLLHAQALWGKEDPAKTHPAQSLPNLTGAEQQLYRQLKSGHWQANLRLEQERIPFDFCRERLKKE